MSTPEALFTYGAGGGGWEWELCTMVDKVEKEPANCIFKSINGLQYTVGDCLLVTLDSAYVLCFGAV